MYNIYINARFLTQQVTGVQRYAIEVVKALDRLIECGIIDNKRYRFQLVSPQNIRREIQLRHIPIKKVGFLYGHIWEQCELPFYTSKGLLLNLCGAAPIIKNNQVVTIHDAAVFAFPQAYSATFRWYYRILFNILGTTAKKIITVSQFSKEELIKYCRIPQKKIDVFYEGKDHMENTIADNLVLKKFNIRNKKFVLAVSSMNPNKNFQSVVRAIELLEKSNFAFVIAGGTNPKVFSNKQTKFSNRVKHVGYISDEELKALYNAAYCFIYPSFYEGFGLPPIEAMTCGCPSIVSNVASMPEVCGDAVMYCNPYDPRDIADKISAMMANNNIRDTIIKHGKKHAALFSWDKCATEIFAAIKDIIE